MAFEVEHMAQNYTIKGAILANNWQFALYLAGLKSRKIYIFQINSVKGGCFLFQCSIRKITKERNLRFKILTPLNGQGTMGLSMEWSF